AVAAGGVMPGRLTPGAGEGRVVLRRRAGVAGGALYPVADEPDGGRDAVAAHGQPREVDVLAMTETLGACHYLAEHRAEGVARCRVVRCLMCHARTSASARRTVRAALTLERGMPASARFSSS